MNEFVGAFIGTPILSHTLEGENPGDLTVVVRYVSTQISEYTKINFNPRLWNCITKDLLCKLGTSKLGEGKRVSFCEAIGCWHQT